MRVLGYIWDVLTNLFAIAVLLAMFSTANSRFETVVIAALALIYLNLIGSLTLLFRESIETAQASLAQFIAIGKLLHDPEASDHEEVLKSSSENYERLTVRYRINRGFAYIMWLIVIWKLLAVTVFASN